MKNTFGWMQLLSSDPKKAQAFYGQLFNWSISEQPKDGGKTYTTIDAGEGSCGGIVQGDKNVPTHWVSFVNVDDIKVSTEKAKNLGAQIIVPITDIGGGQGFYSVFKDPTGAVLGLWGPK